MNFISQGDFVFPFDAHFFWLKHFYIWAFQAGATNLDGLIRLPGRIFTLVIFTLFGNLTASYFYIALSLAIVAFSFGMFCRCLLNIKDPLVLALATLLFTFNPVFLGNMSKVGLVAAAALLPLAWYTLKRFCDDHRAVWLFWCILILNYSLLHPYTFVVNLLFSIGYLFWRLIKEPLNFKTRISKLFLAIVLALGLNAYFIVPLVSIGSLDKSALSQDLSDSPVDYSTLVGIANTGNLYTAFSLSKDVLKDYDFYNSQSKTVYFIASYSFFVVLIGLYLGLGNRLPKDQKTFLLVCMGVILALNILSTGTGLAGKLISWLIGLPGGWIFRSPLKWQLYIPIFLISGLVLLIAQIRSPKYRYIVTGGMLLLLLLQSSYVAYDITRNLLLPKKLTELQGFYEKLPAVSRALYVSGEDCSDVVRKHPSLFTELSQVTTSKNVQVKKVAEADLDRFSTEGFDYIIACAAQTKVFSGYAQNSIHGNGALAIFNKLKENNSALSAVYESRDVNGIRDKELFAKQVLGQSFNSVDTTSKVNTQVLEQPFVQISEANLTKNGLSVTKDNSRASSRLYQAVNRSVVYVQVKTGQANISIEPRPSYVPMKKSGEILTPDSNGKLSFTFDQRGLKTASLLRNGSFEKGPWESKVDDCFNYDKSPRIAMRIEKRSAAQNDNVLALSAAHHIACTSQQISSLHSGQAFLMSYDYQSPDSGVAAYSIAFDDPGQTTVNDHQTSHVLNWNKYSKVIVVPPGAKSARIYLYSYPKPELQTAVTTRYDNVSFRQIPAEYRDIFLLSGSPLNLDRPENVQIHSLNPALRKIVIQGAGSRTLVRIADSYHPMWRLKTISGTYLPPDNHLKLNRSQDAWLVDTKAVCKLGACRMRSDGKNDIYLLEEFTPQRWFYVGGIISLVTLVGCLAYFAYDWQRNRKGQRGNKGKHEPVEPQKLVTPSRPRRRNPPIVRL